MRKKAFTLVEILVVLLISIPILTGLSVVIVQIYNMYDDIETIANKDGDGFNYIHDIVLLAESADYASIENGNITFWKNGIAISLDHEKYGINCMFSEHDGMVYIDIGGGGEFWIRSISEND